MMTSTNTPAATAALIQRGTVTIQFNGLTIPVDFDVHAELPIDHKQELARLAALRCVFDFFATYRGGANEIEEGEAP